MRAEIISIGDELTTGQRLDTNSQWLSERLLEIGVPVAFHTTVGDTLDDNVLVFRQAAERADVIVATGGLGPTADDLTRQALAEVAGVPLVQDDAIARSHQSPVCPPQARDASRQPGAGAVSRGEQADFQSPWLGAGNRAGSRSAQSPRRHDFSPCRACRPK